MAEDKEPTRRAYASLANEVYRFPPSWELTTPQEWQAYQKAEAIMWEFVQVMMYFDTRVRTPSKEWPQATLPSQVYYFLRDTAMKILLNRCELILVDGDWIHNKLAGEYERALGPRPRRRKKKGSWGLLKRWR